MRKRLFYLILFILSSTLYGCWGKVDVNKLTTASAIGLDKSEEGFLVTIQAVNATALTKQLSGNRTPIVVYSMEGKTVFEALRNLTSYYPSRVFMAHFKMLVFGEEFARSGDVEEVMGFLYDDTETRQMYNIAVVKGGKASDLLKITTPVNPNPAAELNDSMKASQEVYGKGNIVFPDEFISSIFSETNGIAITGVEIEGDAEKGSETKNLEKSELETKVKVSTLSVFKKNKLVGWLSDEQSQGFNFYLGKLKGTALPIDFEKDHVLTIDLNKIKRKEKFTLVEGKPKVTVNIDLEVFISGLEFSSLELTKEDIKLIENKTSELVKEKVDSCVEVAQKEFNTDIFKISNLIHRSNPKYYKSIKENYDEVFKEIEVEVIVKTLVIDSPK